MTLAAYTERNQKMADELVKIAEEEGVHVSSHCCGHGDYRDFVMMTPMEWDRFILRVIHRFGDRV